MIRALLDALAELLGIATDEVKARHAERKRQEEADRQRRIDAQKVLDARLRARLMMEQQSINAYRKRMAEYERLEREARKDLDDNPFED